jgi:RNA polymerase sigma factor (sigma-70 family)
MSGRTEVEDLLRRHAPQVLGALVRRYGHFDAAEDAVQEALLAAADQWPVQGVPGNPRGWLIRVASRRLTDTLRAEEARRAREERAAALTPRDTFTAPPPGAERAPREDDTLTLLFLCCHPDLAPSAQIALTLRAVGGLTTAEIARAYLVPEATMAMGVPPVRAKPRTGGGSAGRRRRCEACASGGRTTGRSGCPPSCTPST